jgi:serine phosphatase RsbU (regulator of sigma subunit)
MILSAHVIHADTRESIQKILKNNGNDSMKIMQLTSLANLSMNEPGKAFEVLSEMIAFSERLTTKKNKALCYRKIGTVYHRLQYYDKALEYTLRGASAFDELNDKEGLANCYNNIANSYQAKGMLTNDTIFFNRAIEYHIKNMRLREEIHDTVWLNISYSNISIAFMSLKQYDKAIEYLNVAHEYFVKEQVDGNAVNMTSINLADAYLGKALTTKRPEYYRKALSYYNDLLKVYEAGKSDAYDNHAEVLQKTGQIYFETDQFDRSLNNLLKADQIYNRIRNKEGISKTALLLAKLYESKNDFKKSNEYYNIHMAYRDTLLNERNKGSVEQMQMMYQTGQKDKQIERLNHEKELKDAEIHRQRVTTFASIGGFVLILLLGFLLLSRYNLKKKANEKLSVAYINIELKNKQITDSINYARRIQAAILPPVDVIRNKLNGFFVLYQPKDIVSGDFYWYANHDDRTFFIIGDSTGHGVPGALMSMIGNTLLNEIINQKDILDPGQILTQLHQGVSLALRQQGFDTLSQDDGMDVTVCCIEEKNNSVLHYATANHSLFVKSSKGLTELKGDIYSIGGNFDNTEKKFTTHSVTLEKNSFVIVSTDGYYDQFGGDKNSKFLISRFEKFLLETDLNSNDVSEKLKHAIENWRGNCKQTDDILVAGFRV